jgi:hypothetical protein
MAENDSCTGLGVKSKEGIRAFLTGIWIMRFDLTASMTYGWLASQSKPSAGSILPLVNIREEALHHPQKANPSKGGGAKPWAYRAEGGFQTTLSVSGCQVAEVSRRRPRHASSEEST